MNKKIINKKGFTLIELLAVISILAIIAVIATPNIITLVDNSKKQEFVSDASSFASKALYKYKFEKYDNLFVTSDYYLTYRIGDLTNDGNISNADELRLRKVIAGMIETTQYYKLAGDLNADGKLDESDETLLRKYLAGMEVNIPAGNMGDAKTALISGACKTITLRNIGLEEKTDPDGNNYDLDNSIIKICEEENNGLKEKVSYILLKSTTTETDKRVRGIFDNNSSDKTVNVDTLGIKDVLDLKDLK